VCARLWERRDLRTQIIKPEFDAGSPVKLEKVLRVLVVLTV
jgi:hypothetical protein